MGLAQSDYVFFLRTYAPYRYIVRVGELAESSKIPIRNIPPLFPVYLGQLDHLRALNLRRCAVTNQGLLQAGNTMSLLTHANVYKNLYDKML